MVLCGVWVSGAACGPVVSGSAGGVAAMCWMVVGTESPHFLFLFRFAQKVLSTSKAYERIRAGGRALACGVRLCGVALLGWLCRAAAATGGGHGASGAACKPRPGARKEEAVGGSSWRLVRPGAREDGLGMLIARRPGDGLGKLIARRPGGWFTGS